MADFGEKVVPANKPQNRHEIATNPRQDAKRFVT
jgi:hypothetical protein